MEQTPQGRRLAAVIQTNEYYRTTFMWVLGAIVGEANLKGQVNFLKWREIGNQIVENGDRISRGQPPFPLDLEQVRN